MPRRKIYQLGMHINVTEILNIIMEWCYGEDKVQGFQNIFISKDKVRKMYALSKLCEGYYITVSNKLKPKPH